jgi:DNA-binding response OmpR family regulator
MKKPPEIETAATTNVTVLCVSPDDADGVSLECIFHESGWSVHTNSERTLNVSSRLADDYPWAEALNLGAYDVLAKPFEATEVIRIVSLAWRHWQDRHDLHSVRTEQRKAKTGT